ncbi:MAG: NAD(P)H-binding protein [Thermoleophilaceae bacterium]|nr:NAD(P)H-binding protein [Thermoleophilaceae bacterium]
MILLTGATGLVGSALLRRLTDAGQPVRCLVRDSRRLGLERVRVQIALGDLADPASFRNALRGVDTVIHLAASIRDQEKGSIEELNAMATLRLVRAAERAGAKRFVFFSALNASLNARPRFFRAKALAERAVAESPLETTIFAPSIVYAPYDPYLRILERLSWLPAMPLAGNGETLYQPIWAEDVADGVMAALSNKRAEPERIELAGPDVLSYDAITELALHSFGRRRPLLHLPLPVTRRILRGLERIAAPGHAFATWDEAELMSVSMTSAKGTAGAEELGVSPLSMRAVLGAS